MLPKTLGSQASQRGGHLLMRQFYEAWFESVNTNQRDIFQKLLCLWPANMNCGALTVNLKSLKVRYLKWRQGRMNFWSPKLNFTSIRLNFRSQKLNFRSQTLNSRSTKLIFRSPKLNFTPQTLNFRSPKPNFCSSRLNILSLMLNFRSLKMNFRSPNLNLDHQKLNLRWPKKTEFPNLESQSCFDIEVIRIIVHPSLDWTLIFIKEDVARRCKNFRPLCRGV